MSDLRWPTDEHLRRAQEPPKSEEFPQTCELCKHEIKDAEDFEWHGLGNCAPICDHCSGSGIQERQDPPRVFVDMDGVIVDFEKYKNDLTLPGEVIKKMQGAYLKMQPIPGALAAVKILIGKGYDVWLATKPPTGISFAYADKVSWVLNHLPELKRKIIITHDKSLLLGDYLIDDRPHKANAAKFKGLLIHFGPTVGWPEVVALLDAEERKWNSPKTKPTSSSVSSPD